MICRKKVETVCGTPFFIYHDPNSIIWMVFNRRCVECGVYRTRAEALDAIYRWGERRLSWRKRFDNWLDRDMTEDRNWSEHEIDIGKARYEAREHRRKRHWRLRWYDRFHDIGRPLKE